MLRARGQTHSTCSGQVLLLVTVVISLVFLASALLADRALETSRSSTLVKNTTSGLHLAEAGVQRAIWCLNQASGSACNGTSGDNYSGESNVTLGDGKFTVTASGSASEKSIVSVGAVRGTSKTVRIKARLNTSDVAFLYAGQVGDGCIYMEDNSEIQGNLYSNGDVEGEHTSAQITGDVWMAAALELGEQSTSFNADQNIGSATSNADAAQSFIPDIEDEQTLNKVSLYLKKVGAPTNATVRILADNNGVPSKTDLANATLSASAVGSSYSWVDIIFAPSITLNDETRYWIAIDSDYNATRYYQWVIDAPGSYGDGKGMTSNNWNAATPVWTDANGDLAFKTYYMTSDNEGEIKSVTVGGDAYGNTIEDSIVQGDAYYQEIEDTTVNGASFPGSPDPTPKALPITQAQIDAWKAEAVAGGTITGNYSPPSSQTVYLGPKKITGDLILDNNQTLVVTGTLYVQCNIDVDNNGSIQLDPSFTSFSGALVADGWIHMQNNGAFQGSGNPSSFLMMLTTAEDGTHHDAAIDLHNNVGEGTIFYAANGLVYLHNGVAAAQLTAESLYLNNLATVIYNQNLANLSFLGNAPGLHEWEFIPGSRSE